MAAAGWDRERAFRWYLSCCDAGQEVLYLTLCSLYKGASRNPNDYVNQVLDWTYKKYVSHFNMGQRARMRIEQNNNDYDIYQAAMAYGVDTCLVVLKWTCGLTSPDISEWDRLPPYCLEHRLHIIASNVQQFYKGTSTAYESKERLNEEVTGLKELYKNILQEAECRAGIDLTYSTKAVLSRLDKVLSQQTPVEDPQRYAQLLHREGLQELLGGLISEELQIRPLPMISLRLDSVYSELSLLEQNVEGNFTITPRVFLASKILKEVANGTKELHGHAVVGGPVGSGKSTLFLQLQNYWMRGGCVITDLEKIQFFFIVNLSTTRATTADQLLREELLPRTTSCFPPGRIIPALKKLCVLWVLDGYDRANESAKKLANEIYKKFSLVFLTSQLDFMPVCFSVVIETGIPPMCLILDHPRGTRDSALAANVFQQLTSNGHQKFIQFLVARKRHHDHLMVMPLHVTLLCILYNYSPESMEKVHSLTDLYRHLIIEVINSLTKKVLDKNKNNRENFFIKVVRPWLSLMAEDAWEGVKAGSHLLQDKSLQKVKELCGKETNQLLAGLLASKPGKDDQPVYFWNLGELQDHFAATHLSTVLKNSSRATTIRSLLEGDNYRYNNILVHLLGLLASQNAYTSERKIGKNGVDIVQHLWKNGYGKEKEHCLAGKINRWLSLCLEAKMDLSVLTTVVALIPQLRFGDDDLSLYYPVIEKIVMQYDQLLVCFQIKRDLKNLSDLSNLMKMILHKRHRIWLALVSSATAYGNKQVADHLLEEPIKKRQLQIMSIEGHYSTSFLRSVPVTVQQMHVRVISREELDALASSLHKLKLYSFNLVLDMPDLRHCDTSLPTLNIKWLKMMPSIPSPALWLFIPLMEDSHAPWVLRALNCIYPTHYGRLYLPACRLSLAGERQIVAKLRQATTFTLDELIFDKPDGTCRHFNFKAERVSKREGAGSLTCQ
ncbi:uncharacterized protein LOC121856801 [Homarus americanus]|uniref:uncharacterized protein LOC121856801 n=1 Tax=Homarus americanus TaxID=6706 RepID=UPI001C49366A|nr:uncharacterized protein LOC121856801 [Homarus americanus]